MSNSRQIRLDIQALRAVAVLMVVLFHLWPKLIPGGFAGVDVFFVISGFLISGSLFDELFSNKKISLAAFWAKRVRRLFPAAFLVIFVSAIFMLLFVPPFTRLEFASNGLASLFYVENWHLLFGSADYFAEASASPFQHFWSLAVEEQFYIAWPLLLAVFAGISALKTRKPITVLVTALAASSFFAAAVLTAIDPSASYFNSFLRVWQFALGALVALWLARRSKDEYHARRTRLSSGAVVAVGFLAILVTAFAMNSGAGFPGVPALVPSLGAAAVLIGGVSGLAPLSSRILGLRGIQFLGNISYSLYLWHWPLIILTQYVIGQSLNGVGKVLIFAISILFAWLTKKFVEDKARKAPGLIKARPRATFILALVASLALAGGLMATAGLNAGDNKNFVISLDQAKHDSADAGSKCMTKAEASNVIFCEFGNRGGSRVLLIGDSHAASHLAGFKLIAARHNWSLTLAYKAGCSFSLVTRNTSARGSSCEVWNQALQQKLAKLPPFALVITANYSNNFLADVENSTLAARSVDGFKTAWAPLIKRGAKVIALRDNPQMTTSMFECFSTAITDARACNGEKSKMLFVDQSQVAAKGLTGAYALDLTDLYCDASTCPASRNGTYIYRNADHITATYSKVISSILYERLQNLLGGSE